MTTAATPNNIPLSPVASSALAGVGYDAETQRLQVQFHSGHIHEYTGISEPVAKDFLAAESVGKFFSSKIRSYPNTRLTGKCGKCGDVGLLGVTCADCGTDQYQAE